MAKTAVSNTAPLKLRPRGAGVFVKRIGSTTYRVGVHFSDTSRETMDEKIIRLIRNESADSKTEIDQ